MAEEITDLARQMENYLISHDKAAKQVLILDSQIQQITKRALKAIEDEQTHRATQLMLRKSVTEGVREIYQQYRRQRWQQLQTFVKEVIARLQPDATAVSSDIDESPSEERISVDSEQVNEGTEIAIVNYAESFCEMHRKG